MSDPLDGGEIGEGARPGTLRKVAAGVLVCAVALALGIGYLVSNQDVDASAVGTLTPGVSTSPQNAGSTTEAPPDESVGSTPTEAENKEEPTTPAEPDETEAPEPTSAPAGEDTADDDAPAVSDAELAAIEQPVAEPVALEEPSVVVEGVSATVTKLDAIDGEAIGIGEIAGPAVRFVITVENATGAAVSLGNSVVNVEYGPEKMPAIQLSGSGATSFPASVRAGGSASSTLVFAVPVDQRDSLRILLSVEASSPIAAFEGAAPGGKG